MDTKNLTREMLAGMIDHTNLKAYATDEDLEKLCDEARTNKFAMIAINGVQVGHCHDLLAGSGVHVGALPVPYPYRGCVPVSQECRKHARFSAG